MIRTFINALKIKEIRNRLLYVLVCVLIVRFGCQIPAPFIDSSMIGNGAASSATLSFLNMMTGRSFEKMSIFALNISPYITSSIIMELLTIVIPKLEELHKDGETGRRKIAEISRYLTIGLALLQSVAMYLGFKNQYVINPTWGKGIVIVAAFVAGSAFMMWLGERITEKGIGNGISIILLINIISELPLTAGNIYTYHVKNSTKLHAALVIGGVILLIIITTALIVLLQEAQRKISVQYAKKVQGRKMVGGQSSFIPLKVNTAGVIPVIFAMTLMQLPAMIAGFFQKTANTTSIGGQILLLLNSGSWFKFKDGYAVYSLGVLVYVALIIFFAKFYTSITFNPVEVSNNLKKQGGFIPGVRPGRPTTEFLTGVLNYIIVIGAVMLAIIALIPIAVSGLANIEFSFGGTSLIIIAGVIVETMRQIEGMMRERHYRGFLLED